MANKQRKRPGKSKPPQPLIIPQQPQSGQSQPQSGSHQYSKNHWRLITFFLLVLIALVWIIASILNAPSVIYNTFYAFFAVLGVIPAWLASISPLSPSKGTNNVPKNVKELSLKNILRNSKVRTGAIFAVLLLIGVILATSFLRTPHQISTRITTRTPTPVFIPTPTPTPTATPTPAPTHPVIAVTSNYQQGGFPVGAIATTFQVNGKQFSPSTSITIFLDGVPVPDNTKRIVSNSIGIFATSLAVTSAWKLGLHLLTAQDTNRNTTQTGIKIVIVTQGEAGTPGPNGSPTDDATFTVIASVHNPSNVGFSMILTVSNGIVCDNERDNGQQQTGTVNLDNAETDTYTATYKCNGMYKMGRLSYTETTTSISFMVGDDSCSGSPPYVNLMLIGVFMSDNQFVGTSSSDSYNIDCGFFRRSYNIPPFSGTWTGTVSNT